jgi:hypothetical protein
MKGGMAVATQMSGALKQCESRHTVVAGCAVVMSGPSGTAGVHGAPALCNADITAYSRVILILLCLCYWRGRWGFLGSEFGSVSSGWGAATPLVRRWLFGKISNNLLQPVAPRDTGSFYGEEKVMN